MTNCQHTGTHWCATLTRTQRAGDSWWTTAFRRNNRSRDSPNGRRPMGPVANARFARAAVWNGYSRIRAASEPRGVSVGLALFGDALLRVLELVLEGDDAARRIQWCAVVEEFTDAGGQS